MSPTMEFKIFCLERYKTAHNLNGASVIDIFKKYNVFDYITSFYDVLHSTGQQYIVEEIDLFIKARQENGVLIRPVRDPRGGEFSEQILADLVEQGYDGVELLEKFKQQNKLIRPAVQKLIDETDAFAGRGEGKVAINELFGAE